MKVKLPKVTDFKSTVILLLIIIIAILAINQPQLSNNNQQQVNTNPQPITQPETPEVNSVPENEDIPRLIDATLIDVVDGDTITVEINGEIEKVRIIGINTPENGECFYQEATSYLESLFIDSEIVLEMDSTQGERDRYGRLLAFVFKEDLNIGLEMINAGYAREYTYNKKYKYSDIYKEAEIEPKAASIGIWGRDCRE